MAMTSSPTASRFWVATFNDGKYDAASLPAYVKNLATATDGGAKVRPKLFDYRKKVQALHAFVSALPSHDLVLFLDADVRTFGDTGFARVEGLARTLLRQASADVVLGAELGRYEMPPHAQFWIPSWAHEACPKTIADLHGLAACRQPQGPCSRFKEYKHPNSGMLLGPAWALHNTTSLVLGSRWGPTAITSDQHQYYDALSTWGFLRASLDYCATLVMNWHQMRRDKGVPSHATAPFHHFNGLNKELPNGWPSAAAAAPSSSASSQAVAAEGSPRPLTVKSQGTWVSRSPMCTDNIPYEVPLDPWSASGWCTCGQPCNRSSSSSVAVASAAMPMASVAVLIISPSPRCFERVVKVARGAGLSGPVVHLNGSLVGASEVLANCCPSGYCGKGSRLKPTSRAAMDGGVQAHRAAWQHVVDTNRAAVLLEDDARFIGVPADVQYAIHHCLLASKETNCSLAYLGASYDMLLSHAYFMTPHAAALLLATSKPMCNIHKQDWIIREACISGKLRCTHPPRGYTLSRKQDWHGLLGWGLFIQDHATTPSFTTGYAKRTHGGVNATLAMDWNERYRCANPLDT